jgi:hypothetical protein
MTSTNLPREIFSLTSQTINEFKKEVLNCENLFSKFHRKLHFLSKFLYYLQLSLYTLINIIIMNQGEWKIKKLWYMLLKGCSKTGKWRDTITVWETLLYCEGLSLELTCRILFILYFYIRSGCGRFTILL